MSNQQERFDITPHHSLFPKIGQAGYSLSEAISELIDNSIDAALPNQRLNVTVDISQERITVRDNGSGMSKEEAKNSFKLAHSNKKENQLGQFGLGLKSASTSMGKWFELETTPIDNKERYIIPFDNELFEKEGRWELAVETRPAEATEHGTKITIKRLTFNTTWNTEKKLRTELCERFTPFIASGDVAIRLNGTYIVPTQPEIVEGSRKDFEITLSGGEKVALWIGTLKVGSQPLSGFNMYRNKRLIRAHEKLGYQYHPSKMWITGEIYLDSIPVTTNKREFETKSDQYIEFLQKFEQILKPYLADLLQKQREEKVKDLPAEKRETLIDRINKAINQVDEYKELSGKSGGTPIKRSNTNEGELHNKETRDPAIPMGITRTEVHKETIKTRGRKPKKQQAKKVRFITIAGKEFKWTYDWGTLEENIAKLSEIDRENMVINITLNDAFPLVSVITDMPSYIAIMVSEGIAEVFLKENGKSFDKVINLRDKTMRQFGKAVTEDLGEEVFQKTKSDDQVSTMLEHNDQKVREILSDREVEMLHQRYGIDGEKLTLDAIGKHYKVTRERARQIMDGATKKLLNT